MAEHGAEANLVSAEVEGAVEAAARWLTRVGQRRIEAFDPEVLVLSLFGLGCAYRVLPPDWMEDSTDVAQQISAALAQSLNNPAGEARSWFQSGGAVTALLAAAMQPGKSEPISVFRNACVQEWSALVRRDVLRPSSPAWRMGNHLHQLLAGGAPPAAGGAPAPLAAMSLVPAFAISSEIVQELATDLAVLSGFGGSLPPGDDPRWSALFRILAEWAFVFTKRRDLDLLCPVLRALRYAALTDWPEYLDGIRLILDRAEPDGRFSAQGLAVNLQTLVASDGMDVEREIHLRLTVASLWTLLEHMLPQSPLAFRESGTAPGPLPRLEEQAPGRVAPTLENRDLILQASEAEDRALTWVERHLETFNPLSHRDARRAEYVVKAAAELALLCGLACRGSRHNLAPRVSRIAEYLWDDVFRREPVQELMLANPASLPAFSLYSSLRQCGFEDTRYRRRLERILEDGYVTAAEKGPATQLDLIYSVTKAGLSWTGEAAFDVFRRSLLAAQPPPLPLSDLDVYAFTHTIFFLTDFGATIPSCFSEADFSYARRVLPRLLSYYLTRGHWDLAGELIMAAAEMNALREPLRVQAWMQLLSAQGEHGSFPGPVEPAAETPIPGAEQQPAPPPGSAETTWRHFADDYHTTLVALLAIRTVLSPY
jgi:hypothetical protein